MVGVNKASSLSTSWGTHSLTCWERSKSPFYIYSGNTLFEQYFTEDMGASMSTLGVFIIQIYIFLNNLWTAWRKISQTAPTKRLSCWWHLAWSIVGEIFPTACATEGHKLQEFSSQLHFFQFIFWCIFVEESIMGLKILAVSKDIYYMSNFTLSSVQLRLERLIYT